MPFVKGKAVFINSWFIQIQHWLLQLVSMKKNNTIFSWFTWSFLNYVSNKKGKALQGMISKNGTELKSRIWDIWSFYLLLLSQFGKCWLQFFSLTSKEGVKRQIEKINPGLNPSTAQDGLFFQLKWQCIVSMHTHYTWGTVILNYSWQRRAQ